LLRDARLDVGQGVDLPRLVPPPHRPVAGGVAAATVATLLDLGVGEVSEELVPRFTQLVLGLPLVEDGLASGLLRDARLDVGQGVDLPRLVPPPHRPVAGGVAAATVATLLDLGGDLHFHVTELVFDRLPCALQRRRGDGRLEHGLGGELSHACSPP
jgi:hypothetical protein